jgi:hypothetical protein
MAIVASAVVPRTIEAQQPGKTGFYGKKVSVLKVFGQRNWREASAGAVTGNNVYHASGVAVDRSRSPNAVYVFDSGNNRILGFRSMASSTADRIFGQPDAQSSAPNGDCNLGMFGKPSATSLCLTSYPIGTNIAEQWMRHHIDVDAVGNLYVADVYNNRVLVYFAPFSNERSKGKGDTVADMVIGQPNFTSNGPNRGRGPGFPSAGSLHIGFGGFDHVASRGVSVDGRGNVWVADTFNFRVLRFPKGKTTADLVLGQPDFMTANAEPDLNKANAQTMCTPTIARVDPETGELYVVDEYPGGFPGRVLVFKPPFRSGHPAYREFKVKQRIEGDYKDGYRLTHATALAFNPVKSDDWIAPDTKAHRYRDGHLWLCDRDRCLLLDKAGEILLAIGAPDTTTHGGRYDVYDRSGLDPLAPFNLIWPGGSIGFDSENNIYVADEARNRVSQYALPYRVRKTDAGLALPAANGGLFSEQPIDPIHWRLDRVGVAVFKNQLIVRDHQRYMVWNDYLKKPSGAPADLFIGQDGGDNIKKRNNFIDRSHHSIDDNDRLWAGSEHGKLIVYQLPLTQGAEPLRALIPLFWADEPETEVVYQTQAVGFDAVNRHLWVVDRHRLLRVRNPDDWNGKLLVDAVIGQPNKTANETNRGQKTPSSNSFGDVNSIRFDRRGNLFVVDNTYEGHPNGRVIAFLAADLKRLRVMFPDVQAKRVYCVERFDQTEYGRIQLPVDHPFSPVSVAFSKNNEMVIGNDGYYRNPNLRAVRQLYLYRKPLQKSTPDAVIALPLGAAAEMQFDDNDNLVVMDHTWNKVWVINYKRDPMWLKALD